MTVEEKTIGQESCRDAKKWTDEERIKLYKLAETMNKRWSQMAKEFNVSPNACQKMYAKSNWALIFKRNNITETQVLKELIEEAAISGDKSVNKEKKALSSLEDEKRQALVDLEKHRILQRSAERILRDNINNRAIEELVVDKVMGSISRLPQITLEDIKYPNVVNKKTPEEACLVLSDLHFGLTCLPEEVGHIGAYNKDIFFKRLENLKNSIKKITDIHRNSYKIDTLNIFALGDFVHGSNDAGQWGFLHMETNIMEQVFGITNEVAKTILELHTFYPNINFYGVTGNHGRIGQKGAEKGYVNWDYVCYKNIESALIQNKNIKFVIPKTPFCVVDVLNNRFLLTHGDKIKSWGGIPAYGMIRAESRYQNLTQKTKNIEDCLDKIKKSSVDFNSLEEVVDFTMKYSKPLDYVILGHHHQSLEIEANSGAKVICNSSFIGGDDYTINQLLVSGEASQKFFGIHPEGRSWMYDINLKRE